MDAHPFTWMKSLKFKENKKPKFKNSKKKKKKTSLDWLQTSPFPKHVFKLATCYHCTQTL
jgi:hypothetical protein